VLGDPKKRQMYDQFGHAGMQQQGGPNPFRGGSGFEGYGPFQGNFDPRGSSQEGFQDMFGDFFGEFFNGEPGNRRGFRQDRGADLRYTLTVTLEEAAT